MESPALPVRISQRAPKSCQRCSAKKMKCTKTLPCGPCLDTGFGDQCRREHVITTKHIRQVHRHRRREVTARHSEQTHSKHTSKGLMQQQHVGVVQYDAEPGSEHDLMRIESLGDTHCESDRNAHMKAINNSSSPRISGSQASAGTKPHLASAQGTPEPDVSYYNEQADIENAANSLELLAWGRHRESGTSPNSTMVLNITTRNADVLLPRQARLVLCFHRDWLNWTHNTLHWPTFFKECQDYWLEGIVVEKVWLSIYFAALCAALIVMPQEQQLDLGLSQGVTKQLYIQSVDALKAADYAANHSIRCVQAICLITPSAHVFGGSNLFGVLLSSAIRIAQSLNMHRIGPDHPHTTSCDNIKREREIQKSLWLFLCNQDWFNIPFANAHAIASAHCTTPLPLNCDGISGTVEGPHIFAPVSLEQPTQMAYMLTMYQVADVCRSFFDKTAALNSDRCDDNTLRSLYEHVLTADAQMKTISKTCAPYLRQRYIASSSGNALLSIQRTAFVVSMQNKILSIHRRFFLRSLADRWYTYTKVACLSAAKTALQEYQSASCHSIARNLWQVVAHVIGASIVLLLAMIYSEEDFPDRFDVRQSIQQCLHHLSSSTNITDMLRRGIKLIGIMLQHESEIHSGQRKWLVSIEQIATELQEGDRSDSTILGNDFMEIAGALDLDMILQPFEGAYAPYFSQEDELR